MESFLFTSEILSLLFKSCCEIIAESRKAQFALRLKNSYIYLVAP
jgi:hypothetical protein